ncbi:MAG: DUF4157 domain-containing protein [Myxococcales bacterium]|nr:DUF4157 domain-containing protein [Myxococcales bacterium]
MRQRHDSSRAATTDHAGAEPGRRWPGKVSLTQRMASSSGGLVPPTAPPPAPSTPVQRAQVEHDLAASLGFLGGPAASIDASLAAASPAVPVQRAADGHTGLDDAQVAAHAAAGVRGGGQALPHLDTIQRAFGPAHDLSGVRAHVGGAAAEASAAIGAHAYATGDDVAFAGAPDLFLAAHEAAHVVQQRQGVHLKGAVGQAGDAYEQHADAVAAAVVRGESAAALLGEGGAGGVACVQMASDAPVLPRPQGQRDPFVGSCEGYPNNLPQDAAITLVNSNEVRFSYELPPGHREGEQVLVEQVKDVLSGSAQAVELSAGEQNAGFVSWTATFKRPVKVRLSFAVQASGGKRSETSYRLDVGMDTERIAQGDHVHMDKREKSKLAHIAAELDGWRDDTTYAFIKARTRVNEIIQKDTAKGQASDGIAVSVLSTLFSAGLGAVAGPAVKRWLVEKGTTAGTEIKEELASDMTKAVIGATTSALGGAAPAPPGGLNKNELALWLDYNREIADLDQKLRRRLDAGYVSTKDGHHYLLEDPIGVLNEYVTVAKIPLARRSEESIERELWIEWLESIGAHLREDDTHDIWNEALESPVVGQNYNDVMARLDALGVAYANPDPQNAVDGNCARFYRGKSAVANEREVGKRLAAQEARDRKERTTDFAREFFQPNE